jgi:hypothetical protein
MSLGVVALLIVRPLCDCPAYYFAISALFLVPLVVGPRYFRVSGLALLVLGLLIGQSQGRHQSFMEKERKKVQAESQK